MADHSTIDHTGITGVGGTPAFIGCRAYNNTTQSIPNSTVTALTLNSEEFDTDGIHSTVSNTSRMTIPSGLAGKWYFHAMTDIASGGSAGVRAIWFYKNGASLRGTASLMPSTNSNVKPHTSCIVDLAVGDYIEAVVFQSSGGSLNAGDASNVDDQTTVEAHFLGA